MNFFTFFFRTFFFLTLVGCGSPTETSSADKIVELIERFEMTELQKGIYFKIDYRSSDSLVREDLPERYEVDHVFASSIYYLLTPNGRDYFHRLKSDEIWNYYEGDPIELTVITPDRKLEKVVLGNGIYQYTVRANSWYTVSSRGTNYSLMGLIVVPGFEDSDFTPGNRGELVKLFPEYEQLIVANTKE